LSCRALLVEGIVLLALLIKACSHADPQLKSQITGGTLLCLKNKVCKTAKFLLLAGFLQC
jgi:hypothetical protein